MTVSCRLRNPTSTENSSRMHFSFEGKNSLIPSEYVEVINASTIQLTYPVTKLVNHQFLGCYLNQTDGTLEGIESTRINSDCESFSSHLVFYSLVWYCLLASMGKRHTYTPTKMCRQHTNIRIVDVHFIIWESNSLMMMKFRFCLCF